MFYPSPAALIDQQQTAGPSSAFRKATSSLSSAVLIDQQQTAGPSSAVEDELRKQIAGLEDEIRQLRLSQDPKREAVKYALLQDELAQLRKNNLNLRVELQVAQEVHQALEEKREKYHALESEHERCKNLMQKAMENLSSGLVFLNGESANLGLITERVAPGALLPPQQSLSSPPGKKTSGSHFITPGASQKGQPHAPTSPFHGSTPSSSRPEVKPLFIVTTLKVNKPASSMFGDPEQTVQSESSVEKFTFFNTPGSYNNQEQSFEEARLRRYELTHYLTALRCLQARTSSSRATNEVLRRGEE